MEANLKVLLLLVVRVASNKLRSRKEAIGKLDPSPGSRLDSLPPSRGQALSQAKVPNSDKPEFQWERGVRMPR